MARLRLVESGIPGNVYAGELTGLPFGHGGLTLRTRVLGGAIVGSYLIHAVGGTIRGELRILLGVSHGQPHYSGIAIPKAGTGRFARVDPLPLQVTGRGNLAALTFDVTGSLEY